MITKFIHTPGPWVVEQREVAGHSVARGWAKPRAEVNVFSKEARSYVARGLPVSRLPDARLIAEAPELLKDLKTLVRRVREDVPFKWVEEALGDALDEAESTIRRAEGRDNSCEHENGFEQGRCGECGLYRRSEDFE